MALKVALRKATFGEVAKAKARMDLAQYKAFQMSEDGWWLHS